MLKFDVAKTVNYWLEGAEYDIDVAKALYEKKKYPYALFMGHLALEKLLKAVYVRTTNEHAPYTHSLIHLAERLDIKIPQDMMKNLVVFMGFHFEARYPEEEKKFYKKCTKKFSKDRLREIEEVFTWLRKQL